MGPIVREEREDSEERSGGSPEPHFFVKYVGIWALLTRLRLHDN